MALNHFSENLSLPVTFVQVCDFSTSDSDRFRTKPVTAFLAVFPHDQDQTVTGSDRFPPLLSIPANPLHVRAGKGLRKPVTTCHCAEVAE
jgi:hypothetical protein